MFETQIRRGVAALNADVPGWHRKITLHNLDMKHPKTCVLAQVFGNYYDACAQVLCTRHTPLEVRIYEAGSYLGFEADRLVLYPVLTAEWREAIVALRIAEQPEPEPEPESRRNLLGRVLARLGR